MIGFSYQDIYVAMCGQVFTTWPSGRSHERDCQACQREIRGLSASGPTPDGCYEDGNATIRETFHDPERDIEYHTVRPVAEACCGPDDLKPDDECQRMRRETREINRLDSRDVAGWFTRSTTEVAMQTAKPIPIDDPDNDILRDFRADLISATTPHLTGDGEECECSVKTVTLTASMDAVLLTSAEWEGEYERSGVWFLASVCWRLAAVNYRIGDGRNLWDLIYKVDVQ